MKITIREYKREDFEEVYSLIATIFAVELVGVPAEGYLKDIESAEENYSGHNEEFWVATDDEAKKIIGVVGVKNEYKSIAMLRRIFVHPDYRGKGVGKKLFDKVKNFCRKHNYEEIVFLGNQEMQLAKKAMMALGFREIDGVRVGMLTMFKMAYSL